MFPDFLIFVELINLIIMKTKLLTFFIGVIGLLSIANAQNVTQLVPGKDFRLKLKIPNVLV
jgi:hypothetical protein